MSVTAVPIQPIPKSALVKMWGGVGLAVVLAGGLAWWGTAGAVGTGCGAANFDDAKGAVAKNSSGLQVQTIKPGKGAKPTDADVVLVNYKGSLTDGKEFDAGERVPFPVNGLVPGFTEALKEMQRGGSYKICIPSALGYGATANNAIPANSTLLFDVDLLDFKSMAEIQAMQQQMQQQGLLPPQGGANVPQGAPPPLPGAPPGQ